MKQGKAKGSSQEIAILSPSVRNFTETQRRLSETLDFSAFKQIAETQRRLSETLDFSAFKQIAEAQRILSETLDFSAFKQIAESQRILSETLDFSVFKQMAEAQRILSETLDFPAFKQMAETQKRLSETLNSPVFKQIAETQRRLSNLISKELVFDNWVKTNVQLFDHVNRRISIANLIDSEILPTLENYNWFVTVSLEDSFISDLSRVIKNSSDKLPTAIRQEFISYFSKNNFDKLTAMIKSWEDNPLFKPRMKIFKDSCNLLKHSHNSYNPSNILIPALIAQIDGILTDYLIQNEFAIEQVGRGLVWKDKTNKTLHKVSHRNKIYKKIFDSDFTEYSLANSSMSTTSLEIGNNFILNTLFQTAFTKQKLKKPFGLSRHKIMHGEYVRYGRKEHLIRTYLILDFLYGLKNVDHNSTP